MNSSATHRAGADHVGGWPDSDAAMVDPWRLVQHGFDPDQAARDETLYALANGCVGVRGSFEEHPSASAGSFLVDAWERSPIDYSRALSGFRREHRHPRAGRRWHPHPHPPRWRTRRPRPG